MSRWQRVGTALLSTKTFVYFHISLECDTPILEAIHHNFKQYLFWSSEEFNEMSLFFFRQLARAFWRFGIPKTEWDPTIANELIQFVSGDNRIQIGRLTSPHNRSFVTLTVNTNQNWESIVIAFDAYTRQLSIKETGCKIEWLTKQHLEMQIDDAVSKLCAKHQHLFNN